ncbi:MAG: hypothetical protein IJ651_01335 [Bacteroidales bacterium]|nr:hypothetical protein [Bacteroidales bacterium]
MKRFALIGNPVSGSLSPRLFQAAYAGRYAYDLIEEPSFEAAWRRFLSAYEGINVTAPFKLDAFGKVDVVAPSARLTGAVNLVLRTKEGLQGNNTDVDGVAGAVRETGLSVSDALVVGAGGAARAAVAAALELGCRVSVTNRTLSKAEALARQFSCQAVPLEEAGALAPDLVLYTLPGSAPVPAGLPLRQALVLEAEYKHPVLADVPCRQYISGRRWLLWQAVTGYSLFTGENPDVEKMAAVL